MISTASMLDLIKRAMPSAGYVRHGYTIHEWDISGSCQKPRTRELLSRPLRIYRHYDYGRGSERAYSLIMHVRCRMCDACRKLKSALWTARAYSEVHSGTRSWFGTMTLNPQAQFEITNRARRRLLVGGTDFDELPPQQQFAERMTEVNREVTLWLKRVRKESGAAIRYLLVAEAHKSGEPHLHVLVTETDAERPVRYRTLAGQWTLGFTKFSVMQNSDAVRYVCKYISKSLLARVRASLGYGRADDGEAETGSTKAPEKRIERPIERPIWAADFTLVKQEPECDELTLTDHTGGKDNGIDHEQAGCAAATQRGEQDRLSASGPETDEPPF